MPSSRVPAMRVLLPTAVLFGGLLTGCAPTDESSTSATPAASATGPGGSCDIAAFKAAAKTPGKLTIGTDKPAYSPWFVDDDPTNGKGYESAVAYAVAQQLQYAPADVTWVTASFGSVIQPGAKPFDFDINQFSISDERKKVVDFSSGYYDVTQAVVTVKGSKAAGAKTLAALREVKFGVAVGTTSYTAITEVIKPAATPSIYDDNDKAKLALANGQIDALVVDLPTALYIAAAELDDGVVVGQLPATGGEGEQFGLVLDKGSKLTSCVTWAVERLRAGGILKALEKTWLTDAAGAPELK